MKKSVKTCSYPFSQGQAEELACGIDDKLYPWGQKNAKRYENDKNRKNNKKSALPIATIPLISEGILSKINPHGGAGMIEFRIDP